MSEQMPKRFGKYEIVEEIGRGGFGTVYKAVDTTSGDTVALKVLDPWLLREPGAMDRLRRETNIAQRLDHPNIVKIHEVGEAEGRHYIAMEYLEGESLKALIEKEGALPTERLVHIIEQVADALDYVHGQALLHRDVKPSNVIVGDEDKATLTDFGLAGVSGLSGFSSGAALLGTLPYMSPEQLEGEMPDHRSDVYALAVTAYEMCAGRLPFAGDSPGAIIKAITLDEPTPPSQINARTSAGIEYVILKSLAKDKAARHQSAGAFARELRDASRPEYVVPVSEKPEEMDERERTKPRRLWRRMAILLGSLSAGAVSTTLVVWLIGKVVLPIVVDMVTATPTLLASVTSEATATSTSESPPVIATPRLEATPTPTLSPFPTPSPEPTPTPTPTYTPTPTHVPMPLPFEDNFDMGPRPEWEPVQGTWRMVDGAYAADDPGGRWAYSMVGDVAWQDYAVEVDVAVRCLTMHWGQIGVLVRSKSPGEGIQFQNNRWVLSSQGQSKVIAEANQGLPDACMGSTGTTPWEVSHLRVEAHGNTYSAYINGVLVSRVQDGTFAAGRAGLGTTTSLEVSRFDDFVVVPLG